MSLPPGFRFHPTDVELIMYYLKRKVMGKKIRVEAISEINIYKYSPWDLPDLSCLKSKDLEWFFFCPRERKYASGERMNRATQTGYWKTTGKDRYILYEEKNVGMVKTLVFHLGPAPRGERTDWVIHEYRINDQQLTDAGIPQDTYVLCKVFKKNGPGPKNGAQYGAPFKEEEWDDDDDETQVSFQTSLFGIQSANGASTSASPPPIPALLAEIPSCSLAISGVSPPPPPPAEAPTDLALLDNDDEITRLLASFTPDHIDNTEMLMLPSCLSDSNEIWNNIGEVGGTWGELGDNGLSIADYGCNEDAFLELNDLTRPLNNPNPSENIQMMNMEGFNQYQYQYQGTQDPYQYGGSSKGTGYLNDVLQMQQRSANTGYSFSDEGGVNVNNGGNQMYCTTNTSSTPAYDMENTTIDPPAGYGGMDPTTGFQNFQ